MKESDIRPAYLFEEYLKLSAKDAEHCFDGVERKDILCVACNSDNKKHEFDKHGFSYELCELCGTLFQSPRPSIESFESFYNDSPSSKFWAEEFFPKVAEARRERIFQPRVKYLAELCAKKGLETKTIMDVGAGYGIFLEEWRSMFPQTRSIAVEPSHHLSEICRSKGFEVVEQMAEKVSGYNETADLVVCFEVLEHVHKPLVFINTLSNFVSSDGYLMVSTLGVDGFDIQLLWEKSNSVSPPHHINFLSIKGFKQLFKRAGFSDIEILTPGVLDVDIVRNAVKVDPSILSGQRFIQKLISNGESADNFQRYLIDAKLSSHTWILAKKTN
jgi:SAM-dependent methyltransferase